MISFYEIHKWIPNYIGTYIISKSKKHFHAPDGLFNSGNLIPYWNQSFSKNLYVNLYVKQITNCNQFQTSLFKTTWASHSPLYTTKTLDNHYAGLDYAFTFTGFVSFFSTNSEPKIFVPAF